MLPHHSLYRNAAVHCRDPTWVAENAGHTSDFIQRKLTECGWHDGRVHVVRLDEGHHGVAALQHIAKGEVVIIFGGKVRCAGVPGQLSPS